MVRRREKTSYEIDGAVFRIQAETAKEVRESHGTWDCRIDRAMCHCDEKDDN